MSVLREQDIRYILREMELKFQKEREKRML